MNYIILAAGKGTRLHPLTVSYPKSSYSLDKNTTVLQRMVRGIRSVDVDSNIVVVVGFQASIVEEQLKDENCIFVKNPFYEVTNSAASLWFAKDFLKADQVTIINGDVVLDKELMEYLSFSVKRPEVLVDSSIRIDGDYNVQVVDGRVVMMSKELSEYYGEYVGVTKLDSSSANLLDQTIEEGLSDEMYDQWYENVLVHMIFRSDFSLGYKDVSENSWTEVDSVNDLMLAKKIYSEDL